MRNEPHRSRMMRFALLTTSYGIALSSYAGGANRHERQVGQSYANLTVGGTLGLLRQGRFSQIDAVNIAEELEDMGRSETRALGSHLTVLQLHLLQWQFQPERRGSSWRGSIYNARCAIADLLRQRPR